MLRLFPALLLPSLLLAAEPPRKFAFTSDPQAGFTPVTAAYATERGFGFDLGTTPDKPPFYFSVALPEGNRNVTVTLGESSATTIKAESRRLQPGQVGRQARGELTDRTAGSRIRSYTGGGVVRTACRAYP
jgi:hypothetical protein